MITKAITHCLESAQKKGWKRTYWAFDIHGTILKPTFNASRLSTEFYPEAVNVLKQLTHREDIITILYTCSYPHEIEHYTKYFEQEGIRFDYVNENPEIADGAYGYYQHKFYFNVLLDDKAGFDGDTDWPVIAQLLNKFKPLNNK